MSFRIGAVSYLNTKPLIHQLENALPNSKLTLDLPSRLADQLHAGQLDVALIPSIEYFRSGSRDIASGSLANSWFIVSDACIACRGPVWSVKLLFRTPPRAVRTLALDEGSRTSAALAQILLLDRFGLRPRLLPLPIGCEAESSQADAVLVIGDRALHGWGDDFCECWDMGEEWFRATGLPFVFAMWVARQASDSLAAGLEAARDAGLLAARQIAARQASNYGLTEDACLEYFEKFLHFKLGTDEQQGLAEFYYRAAEIGLVPAGYELPWMHSVRQAIPMAGSQYPATLI